MGDDNDKQFKSLAPVLFVEAVEPCVAFWREKFGFEMVQSVPEGDALGFALLVRDDVTIMYQSLASLRKDMPALAEQPLESCNVLYISVASIDTIEGKLEGVEKVVPRRTTFYGTTEIAVRDPAGYLVTFAEHGER